MGFWKSIKLGLGIALGLALAKLLRWILLALVVGYAVHSVIPSPPHEIQKPAASTTN